jgi:hypothetical protein
MTLPRPNVHPSGMNLPKQIELHICNFGVGRHLFAAHNFTLVMSDRKPAIASIAPVLVQSGILSSRI